MPFYEAPNPYLQLEKSALYINRQTMPWQRRRVSRAVPGSVPSFFRRIRPCRAGGISQCDSRPVATSQRPHLIVLSAKNEDRLKARIADLLAFLSHDTRPRSRISPIRFRSGVKRMKSRLASFAASRADLLQTLRAVSADARSRRPFPG